MSAAVCGKRSLFDDLHGSPPIAKRLRCSQGSSPIRFPSSTSPSTRSGTPFEACLEAGSPRSPSLLLDESPFLQLRSLFPDMDAQLVERVLESCGNNLDSAIKSLNDLRLSSSERTLPAGPHTGQETVDTSAAGGSHHGVLQPPPNSDQVGENRQQQQQPDAAAAPVQLEGMEWVEFLVREMMSATDMDDARARVTRALEAFEKTVSSRTGALAEVLQKDNLTMKEQLQGLLRDNHILKRAVVKLNERQLEHDERCRELQHTKQLLAQYQEQLRTLELNNYALTLHLRKAQEGSSMPGRFHPDVF